jgi:uncharacterized protein
MSTLANPTTPGVYIQEVTGPGIITGVGTSTAAFVGPALNGPVMTPVLITSWEDFFQTFGPPNGRPDGSDAFMESPQRFYMAHAVKSFYENGGTLAYIVRIGTAAAAYYDLPDGAGAVAFRLQALQQGSSGDNIQVSVQNSQSAAIPFAVPATQVATAGTTTTILVQNVSQFRPGDLIATQAGGNAVTGVISSIDPNNKIFYLAAPLPAAATVNAAVTLADVQAGVQAFRLQSTTGIAQGSVIQITNTAAGGSSEVASVSSVSGVSGLVTLDAPLKAAAGGYPVASTTVSIFLFAVTVQSGAINEQYNGLSMDARNPQYFVTAIGNISTLVTPIPQGTPQVPTNGTAIPNNRPVGPAALTGLGHGADDAPANLIDADYSNGVLALDQRTDVNLICVPDRQNVGFQTALLAHCIEPTLRDRFAVLDPPAGLTPTGPNNGVLQYVQGTGPSSAIGLYDNLGFGAIYYPWVSVNRVLNGVQQTLLIPPSGVMAGLYARVDDTRGVHKAPANEQLLGVVGLERMVTDAEQGVLNPNNINVLRIFPGQGQALAWGARTVVQPQITDWTYVSTRRLTLYIEQSIKVGTQWAVFEPNNLQLWQKVKRTITEFLTRVWRAGALFGATADQAFYVRVDAALNPDSERKAGRLNVEIGFVPSYPAEFIIVRIGLWDGGASVTES